MLATSVESLVNYFPFLWIKTKQSVELCYACTVCSMRRKKELDMGHLTIIPSTSHCCSLLNVNLSMKELSRVLQTVIKGSKQAELL